VVSHKAARTGRLPVSRAVLWTGIAAGVFLATEVVIHGAVLPLALNAAADAAITFLLIVAAAIVLAELTRRHHRTVARHAIDHGKRAIGYGGRLSAAGTRRVHRHGRTVLAWLAAKAGPRWERREHRPLMFRRLRGEPESAPADEEPVPADQATYSWGHADSPYGWPADHLETAAARARHMSTGGEPYVVIEYPPGGGPGRTVATYLNGKPSTQSTEGTTTMPASKIDPGRRARRTAAKAGGAVPSEWGPVIAQAADFEPENDGELLEWMTRQVTGLSGWAEALVDFYEHCTSVIGIDPQASAMLHDVADAAAQAAETMGAAKAKFTEHYELPREFAASGGLMTHDGRWITGEGA
jgi:hypothetical protein